MKSNDTDVAKPFSCFYNKILSLMNIRASVSLLSLSLSLFLSFCSFRSMDRNFAIKISARARVHNRRYTKATVKYLNNSAAIIGHSSYKSVPNEHTRSIIVGMRYNGVYPADVAAVPIQRARSV